MEQFKIAKIKATHLFVANSESAGEFKYKIEIT